MEVRLSNLTAAKGAQRVSSPRTHLLLHRTPPLTFRTCLLAAVADAVRTSLGPRGMDKMIQTAQGEVVITNDGATILKHMSVLHPAARMVSSTSQSLRSKLRSLRAARRPLGSPGHRGRRRHDFGCRSRRFAPRRGGEAARQGHSPDRHCRVVCTSGGKGGRVLGGHGDAGQPQRTG